MTELIRTVAIGLAYAVLGMAGLALAIPPGYASPLFPAAGMAIALALCFGNRILPGVWLGSLTINIVVSTQNDNLGVTSAMVAALLATGATLQTWGARTMVVRWRGNTWRFLETEKDIFLFMIVATPLACIISATIGIGTLSVAGIIAPAEMFYSWWSWWVGDTLGVLIFTPLTLIVLLRADSPWKGRLLTIAFPMLITLCLVVVVFLGVARYERTQLAGRIGDYGHELAQLLDRRFVAHQEALASLSRLIEVTPDMTFQQFDHFTRITLRDNRDVFALSFNPVIRSDKRRVFEHSFAKKSPVPNFMITERNGNKLLVPAADRPNYVVVGYIAPLEGNQPAIGFDINSEPIRRNAIDRVRASGKPAVTAPIQLVQEKHKRVGVLLLHPAYGKGDTLSGSAVPVLSGFAVGVIKIDEMIQIATQHIKQPGIVFHITDPQADANHRILFQSDGGSVKPMGQFLWRTRLKMADRQWNLDVFPTKEYLREQRSWLAWGTGIVGLLFSALLQIMMLAMTGRTSVIQRKVSEQTIELMHAKEQSESAKQG